MTCQPCSCVPHHVDSSVCTTDARPTPRYRNPGQTSSGLVRGCFLWVMSAGQDHPNPCDPATFWPGSGGGEVSAVGHWPYMSYGFCREYHKPARQTRLPDEWPQPTMLGPGMNLFIGLVPMGRQRAIGCADRDPGRLRVLVHAGNRVGRTWMRLQPWYPGGKTPKQHIKQHMGQHRARGPVRGQQTQTPYPGHRPGLFRRPQ